MVVAAETNLSIAEISPVLDQRLQATVGIFLQHFTDLSIPCDESLIDGILVARCIGAFPEGRKLTLMFIALNPYSLTLPSIQFSLFQLGKQEEREGYTYTNCNPISPQQLTLTCRPDGLKEWNLVENPEPKCQCAHAFYRGTLAMIGENS